MIPIKLQLKNFLSYGPDLQTIHFDPYHLICLSGKNGHGKSALLDAITWALWGQARKVSGTTKADQGLLRLGQTQMMVIFDFTLGNNTYRIKREFMQTYGKPYASLEFGLVNNETNQFIPLTDKTIRATQKKIEETIHLDFDSFTNSAFLRQGNANEFSKKSPKERKEILASILGLNQYDILRKLAMEKTKQALTEKNSFILLHEKLLQELKQKSELNKVFSELTEKLKQCAQEEARFEEQKNSLAEDQKKLLEKQKQLDILQFQYKKIEEEINNKSNEFSTLTIDWRKTHYTLIKLPDFKKLEIEKKELTNQLQAFQKNLQKLLVIKEQQLKVKEEKQQLEHQLKESQSKALNKLYINQQKLLSEKEAYNKTLQTIEQQEKELIGQQEILALEIKKTTKELKNQENRKKLASLEKQFEKRKEHYQKYIALGNLLNTERNQLRQKMKLVHDENDPSCPLCEQNLSATRRKFLKQKFVKTENTSNHRFQRISQVITKLKEILFTQHKKIELLKKQVEQDSQKSVMLESFHKTSNDFKKRLADYEKKKKEVIKQKIELDKESLTLDKIIKETNEKNTEPEKSKQLSAALQELEQEIAQINYQPHSHKKTEESLKEIENQLILCANAQETKALQIQRTKQISLLNQQIKKLRKDLVTLRKEIEIHTTVEKQKNLEIKLNDLNQNKKNLYHKKDLLLQEKGNIEAQQTKLKQFEQEYAQHEQKINQLQKIIDDYQAIASASGKDGIQALLIEDAIPEIEQEANILLSKLTNNQAQLFIESLRDLKKGGTKETLDIKISDSSGIRPYELFSGGEAFRIDFALRIAISKLLARRAGTALQTLIIDEGFGSQDEEGLALIMDAIYKIQDDFEKVIIVSHLTAMKDQFPVHFIIEKKPFGSSVQVIEQG